MRTTVAVRPRPDLRGGASRCDPQFPRTDRNGDRRPQADQGPARHGLHDRALHRGVPVQGQRAALHRLHPRRQAGELARRPAAEIPDGRDLRPRLRALLRTRLPAQVRRRGGRHQDAEALCRRPAEGTERSQVHPRHDHQAARGRHEGGGRRRRSGRHLRRLSSAAARLPRRRVREDRTGRRHGADRHPQLSPAQGHAGARNRHHRRPGRPLPLRPGARPRFLHR